MIPTAQAVARQFQVTFGCICFQNVARQFRVTFGCICLQNVAREFQVTFGCICLQKLENFSSVAEHFAVYGQIWRTFINDIYYMPYEKYITAPNYCFLEGAMTYYW